MGKMKKNKQSKHSLIYRCGVAAAVLISISVVLSIMEAYRLLQWLPMIPKLLLFYALIIPGVVLGFLAIYRMTFPAKRQAAPQDPAEAAAWNRRRTHRRKIILLIVLVAVLGGSAGGGICFFQKKVASEAAAKVIPPLAKTAQKNQQAFSVRRCSVAIKEDGRVLATKMHYGYYSATGQDRVAGWKDMIAVATGEEHTAGLKKDGTVLAVGSTKNGACDVRAWKDITQIAAGAYHTVGLKKDGTVVSAKVIGEDNDDEKANTGQSRVGKWKDVTAVAAGRYHTVGLKKDGTVVATHVHDDFLADFTGELKNWKDIIAIAVGEQHTVGLRKDGTVVASGTSYYGECNVKKWKDVIAIAASDQITAGLKKDGTVLFAGDRDYGAQAAEKWKDIIAIQAGPSCIIGLRKDGTLLATKNTYKYDNGGSYDFGQARVGSWKHIRVIQ
jgi:hypothetical protein